MELMVKLASANLESHVETHSRLKRLAATAASTEDHVSRLGLALSISRGPVGLNWVPDNPSNEVNIFGVVTGKQIRGKTLFKDDLGLWMALALQHQTPEGYSEWRKVMIAHWERGVQMLTAKLNEEGDWLRTLYSCIGN